jgi:hypothetical protein
MNKLCLTPVYNLKATPILNAIERINNLVKCIFRKLRFENLQKGEVVDVKELVKVSVDHLKPAPIKNVCNATHSYWMLPDF